MAGRPSTPPRHSGSFPPNPLTPEQVRRTEEARLKAKAQRQQHDATSTAGQKRTHAQLSPSNPSNPRHASAAAALTNPAADAAVVLRPARNMGKYIEYDFSKMRDTKGGFLSAADDPHNKALHADTRDPLADKPAHMTVEEWERSQLLQKLRAAKAGPFEPGLSVLTGKDEAVGCRECGALGIDWTWREVFGTAVCGACKDKFPERYSLLTKTEAREDYLLTNEELQDEQLLPHLKRPNPHKATWNDMQLYLRYQVEGYAFGERRWGSQEALDAEFERREGEKKARKEKKFKSKLNELKKRTRTEALRRKRGGGEEGEDAQFGVRIVGRNDRHVHEWGTAVMDPESGVEVKTCVECGMECEELDL